MKAVIAVTACLLLAVAVCRYIISQLGQLSLASLRGRLINRVPVSAGIHSYSFIANCQTAVVHKNKTKRMSKIYKSQYIFRYNNVTSAGWQVTLCDPIWHVSSRSGEACCKLSVYRFFTFVSIPCRSSIGWTDGRWFFTETSFELDFFGLSKVVFCLILEV